MRGGPEHDLQLLLGELLAGLEDEQDRFDAGAGLTDHSAHLVGLACDRLGGWEREQRLAGFDCLEPALGIGRRMLDDDVSALDARRRLRSHLTGDLSAAGNLHDQGL